MNTEKLTNAELSSKHVGRLASTEEFIQTVSPCKEDNNCDSPKLQSSNAIWEKPPTLPIPLSGVLVESEDRTSLIQESDKTIMHLKEKVRIDEEEQISLDLKMDIHDGFRNVDYKEYVLDSNDTNLYCSVCMEPFTPRNFFSHLTKVHQIQHSSLYLDNRSSIPALIPKNHANFPKNPVPDSNGTNFHCSVCNIKYPTLLQCRQHLQVTHNVPSRNPSSTILNPDITPDINNPNHYCGACDRNYRDNKAFKNHLLRIHRITSKYHRTKRFARPDVVPDIDSPDFYCATCDEYYANKKSYRTHVSFKHFLHIDTDNVDVPKYPCEVCNAVYTREDFLKNHVIFSHRMELTPSTTSSPNNGSSNSAAQLYNNNMGHSDISANNKDSTETAETLIIRIKVESGASKTSKYSTQGNNDSTKTAENTTKMIKVDSEVLNSSQDQGTIVYPDLLPDEDNPNFYCRACDKCSRNNSSFRIHLIRVHRMQVKSRGRRVPIINPDVIPDENNSDLYCAACERKFANRITFRTHIVHKHNMEVTRNTIKRKVEETSVQSKSSKIKTESLDDGDADFSMSQRKSGSRKILVDDDPVLLRSSESISTDNGTNSSGRPIIRRNTIINHHTMPDINDPNNYCGACDKIYVESAGYRRHLGKCHNFIDIKVPEFLQENGVSTLYFYCQLCRMTFSNKELYSNHLKQLHNMNLIPRSSTEDFTCRWCNSLYTSKRGLAAHLTNFHHEPTEPNIPKNDDVQKGTNLEHKKKEKANQGELKCECDICGKLIKNKYLLGTHKENKHSVFFIYDEDNLHCNLCNGDFSRIVEYDNHLKNVHRMDLPSFLDKDSSLTPLKIVKKEMSSSSITTNVKKEMPSSSITTNVKKEMSSSITTNVKKEMPSSSITTNVKKTKFSTPDLSDPTNTHCRVCDLNYNSVTHYHLHCLKFHEVS